MWEFWRSHLSKTKQVRRGSDGSESPVSARSLGEVNPFHHQLPGTSPEFDTHVYFKDLLLPATPHHHDDEAAMRVDKQKLVIILVGLPGRGKTFLCNKLICYLNWLGHETRHFNVGHYRRREKDEGEIQDASFFDKDNEAGKIIRNKALMSALEDMLNWLSSDEGQVAVFDATNSTEERRMFLRDEIHGKFKYLFIESICNDPQVLEQNYRFKMMYSPDYHGVDTEKAISDFKERVAKYEEVYETITSRDLHYIKLIDMVTGRGYMDVNRISGYIPGKIVFFLMQVCKAGVARMRKIWLTRHGESEWNLLAKLGGNSNLSKRGSLYAALLPDILIDRVPLTADGVPMPVSVWTSTLKRTIETAQWLPFPKLRWKALDEIHAGVYEGMTYEEINANDPVEFEARKKDKLRYRYPSGESYMDVIQRLESVVIEIERERECVCIVAHQAVLRAIYRYFTKAPLNEIPRLEVPLHTLIELTPKPDGTMAEERFFIDVDEYKETVSRTMSHITEVSERGVSLDSRAMSLSLSELRTLSLGLDDRNDSSDEPKKPPRTLPVDNTDI